MNYRMNPNVTIREAYAEASSFLQQQASMQDPARVCEWMMMALLNWNRTDLYLKWEAPFSANKREQWEQWISRKAEGEPVQYILGEQEFYGLTFQVNASVLIPRPETEVLVEAMLQHGKRLWPESVRLDGGQIWLADIGTGSGAIPITMAMKEPNWQMIAVDISPDALETARRNAEIHQVAQRLQFYHGDLLTPLIEAQAVIDILISNPPYIPSADILKLQPEVLRFEPMLALDGGADGLDLYKRMIDQMAQLPQYPKLVGLEVGQGQAKQVADLLIACSQWEEVLILPDLAGIDRHVLAWRQAK